ncbi:MAG: minor capsid protein, partial [Planctomycetia bacterium]|nr:minor capsid protein [Planctomycetia bacterium]
MDLNETLDYLTRLQGVANTAANDVADILSDTEGRVLQKILREIGNRDPDIRREIIRLKRLISELESIRSTAVDAARQSTIQTGRAVADTAQSRVVRQLEMAERSKRFPKTLTDKQLDRVLRYQTVDGLTIEQWFSSLQRADLERITQAVQRASVENMSVDGITAMIRGTKSNGYADGILTMTRQSAQTIARTVINGVSNNTMMETCLANADILDGIRYLSTLDGRTCFQCGMYDGQIWQKDEYDQIRRPPLHRNCRCALIPYVDVGEGSDPAVASRQPKNRPAANADFARLAEEAYNRQARSKGSTRRWEDLSASTRRKYYYQAQKDYESDTGKSAYRHVSQSTRFVEYFESQPESFRRSWLGPTRYAMYREGKLTTKSGKLDFTKIVNPGTGYVVPVGELRNQSGRPGSAASGESSGSGVSGKPTPVKKGYQEIAGTAQEVLERCEEEIDRLNAELSAVERTPGLSDSERREKLEGLRRQRDRVVIDAWLPLDDP